jgi:hypothetical protein
MLDNAAGFYLGISKDLINAIDRPASYSRRIQERHPFLDRTVPGNG